MPGTGQAASAGRPAAYANANFGGGRVLFVLQRIELVFQLGGPSLADGSVPAQPAFSRRGVSLGLPAGTPAHLRGRELAHVRKVLVKNRQQAAVVRQAVHARFGCVAQSLCRPEPSSPGPPTRPSPTTFRRCDWNRESYAGPAIAP